MVLDVGKAIFTEFVRDSNRSCNLPLTSSGGSHIGFCANGPPEVKLNLFAVVFENFASIPNTMPNCRNKSASARLF